MRRGLRREDVDALEELPSVVQPFCCVCGRTWPLNQHHDPWRSEVRGAHVTVTLCGFGNHLRDAQGPLCHGLAHAGMLHFRNNGGRREYLRLDRPTRYLDALEMGGWEPTREEGTWE